MPGFGAVKNSNPSAVPLRAEDPNFGQSVTKHTLIQALGRRKLDVDDPDLANKESKLDRCLELKDLTLIGIGSTLGAGVYILAGEVAANKAGPAVILCFFVAAIASILSGICYAELGSRVPKAGSGYAYLYHCIGELAAFTIGWCLVLSYIVGASSVAGALSAYLNDIAGGFFEKYVDCIPLPEVKGFFRQSVGLTSILILIILGAIMCKGMSEASRLTNFCTIVNILTLTLISVLLVFCINFDNWGYSIEKDADTGKYNIEAVRFFFDKFYHGNHDGMKDQYCSSTQSYESNLGQPYFNDTHNGNYQYLCKPVANYSRIDDQQMSIELETGYGSQEFKYVDKSNNQRMGKYGSRKISHHFLCFLPLKHF